MLICVCDTKPSIRALFKMSCGFNFVKIYEMGDVFALELSLKGCSSSIKKTLILAATISCFYRQVCFNPQWHTRGTKLCLCQPEYFVFLGTSTCNDGARYSSEMSALQCGNSAQLSNLGKILWFFQHIKDKPSLCLN